MMIGDCSLKFYYITIDVECIVVSLCMHQVVMVNLKKLYPAVVEAI